MQECEDYDFTSSVETEVEEQSSVPQKRQAKLKICDGFTGIG